MHTILENFDKSEGSLDMDFFEELLWKIGMTKDQLMDELSDAYLKGCHNVGELQKKIPNVSQYTVDNFVIEDYGNQIQCQPVSPLAPGEHHLDKAA